MDKDIGTKEDKDINTKENKNTNTDTKENKDYNTILYKFTARSKANSDTGSNKFSILAKLKQDTSLINARVLTKVTKSNTASKYIASINKLTDLVN